MAMNLLSSWQTVRRTAQRLMGQAGPPLFDWQHPEHFEAIEDGSGPFGRWIVDDDGLPAYRYEMDQYRDLRAQYPNSQGFDLRTHWHVIGNDRINVAVTNDGPVQVYLSDRGGVWLNWIALSEADLPFLRRVLRAIARGDHALDRVAARPAPPRGRDCRPLMRRRAGSWRSSQLCW